MLRRQDWHGAEIIVADLWAFADMQNLNNSYTTFSATVWLQFVGDRYKIIQSRYNRYVNEFWRDLEERLSNLIIVNE